jgi:ribonucleoside-diphosphate reductase alpha chain
MLAKTVCPSMRAFSLAGKALDAHHIGCYNCAYTTIEKVEDFAEILYILMHGAGVGFSPRKKYINKLPTVEPISLNKLTQIVVFEDNKKGWHDGILQMLKLYFLGIEPILDLTKIRPKGSILKTFGGHASGPEPLEELNINICNIFNKIKTPRKLTPLECIDIICYIAQAVMVGGKRRSALIALTDLDDMECANAKVGEWYIENNQRYIVNISAVYDGDITQNQFLDEWRKIQASGSGERGIFNLNAVRTIIRDNNRSEEHEFGFNPCGEIVLRSKQFCNLTEVILRENDTFDMIKEKIRVATIIGTYQSTFTKFKVIDPMWQKNCEEERLLGVSLTGIMD